MLDPRIIMGGQGPNVIGSFSGGVAAGQQARQAGRQNALADLYQTQGAGIANGDPTALNALAGLDPMASLQVQGARQDMDAQKQSMAMQAEQAKRAAAEYARGLSAEQRQAEAAKLEQGLSGAAFFYSKGDQQGYEAFLSQNGIDPAQFPFEAFPAHAATMGGVLDVLKGFQPEAPGLDRYKVVGGSLFDLAAEGGPQPIGQGAMQEETVFGPDGKPLIVRGGPGAAAKFTEGQSKDNVYATRAEGALAALEGPVDTANPDGRPLVDSLASLGENLAERLPVVGNYLLSDSYQTARTAADEFLQAILRKDTGAAITQPEQNLYGVTYIPQPGDGPQRLAYKRQARARAVEAIKAGMNAQQIEAMARAAAATLQKIPNEGAAGLPSASSSKDAQGGSDFANMPFSELMSVPLESLSNEQLRAYNEALRARGQ